MADPRIPEWAAPFYCGEGTVNCDGENYNYVLLKSELNPMIQYFTGFPDGSFLFISKEVPEKWRPPILRHEIRCFKLQAIRPTDCTCCHSASQWEQDEVLAEDWLEYKKMRARMFQGLIEYMKHAGSFDPEATLSI